MKIPYQNNMVDAVEVEPITSKEEWNEYQLANGEVLLIKAVLIRALRAVGIKTPDGTPLYNVNTQIIAKVRPTEKSNALQDKTPS